MNSMEAVVLTPSFGRYSEQPDHLAVDEGLRLVRRVEGHPKTAAQVINAVEDAEAVIVGLDVVTAEVFAACPSLRVVAKHGVGVDNIDCAAARESGVRVVNAPGANADSVADVTLAHMLAGSRRLAEADASVRAGRWEVFFGRELRGKTLGILGFGRIGRGVATRALAFGMNIVAYDPFVSGHAIETAGVRPGTLDDVVGASDILTLHLPLPPDGRPVVDAQTLGLLPHGAGVINAARGGVVDENALAQALHEGRVGFAGIDAFSQEPPAPDHPLLHAPHVLASPHIGAYSDGANAAMGVASVRNTVAVLRGQAPEHPVV